MYEIFDSSSKLSQDNRKKKTRLYPWENTTYGKSFRVPHSEIKFSTLRSQASYWGKRLGKQFKVIDHGVDIGYEVGCIGLRDKANKKEPVKVSHWADTKPE
jgi:hypothetical protein